ncbi:hypothetical protein HMPREF3156_00996 [Neisseria sp. HMSC06F02]|nr:hypothetical protein HMPREF3156_00996 [Neisseria sp. HMSC06F02]
MTYVKFTNLKTRFGGYVILYKYMDMGLISLQIEIENKVIICFCLLLDVLVWIDY